MKTTILCILDGWGNAKPSNSNAISQAKLKFWNKLINKYPTTELQASENFVGLPKGQMGNSEVGHMNIGAGRLILQDLPKINEAFVKNDIKDKPNFKYFIKSIKESGGDCHIMGLFSPGGVHSHQDHILKLSQEIAAQNINVIIHAFLDGRDTPSTSALKYILSLENSIEKNPRIKIGTIAGRFYAMDRDERWDRIDKAFQTIVFGEGASCQSAQDAIKKSYQDKITDEFILPTCIDNYPGINLPKDGILMANFRADRAREILMSLVDKNFKYFNRKENFLNIPPARILGMVEYSSFLKPLCPAIFQSISLKNTLGEVVSKAKKTQLRIAETEKYAHVTFFLNGGYEDHFPGEQRILIKSPNVKTYDQKPEMSALKLTTNLINAIESKKFNLIVVNYANPDMVGHTGNLKAAIYAAQIIDKCLERVTTSIIKNNGQMLITADHGNLEEMINLKTGEIHTAHTCNPVPCIIVSDNTSIQLERGTLCNIAPTILDMMELKIPKEMNYNSLINTK